MKKVLIFALALVMLFSCVACSDNNDADPEDTSAPLPGSKYPLLSELPMEMRPPVKDEAGRDPSNRKPFNSNDPRKKYLEDKYGVTAYLIEERTAARLTTLFTLDGYEKIFALYAKDDLIKEGVPAESIPNDYIDNAYFTVAYSEIYEYFAKAVEASGVKIERMIIKDRVMYYATSVYDPNKSFAECLASTDRTNAKRFEIRLYADFGEGDEAYKKLFREIQKLDFTGTLNFYDIIKDISNLTNDDLMDYSTYKDYVVSSYPLQQIK